MGSSYQAPPAPDYAAANTAAIYADANTLPFRLSVSSAANQGIKWTDPESGRVYDFTGLGLSAQNQSAIDSARQLMQAGSDISLEGERKRLQSELELLPQFNKLNLDQQQAAIDQALNASRSFTENSLNQNLDYLPKFGEAQRAENEKAFAQNLELGRQGTYESAKWQEELLPMLNKVFSGAQSDTLAAATAAGRAANPEAYAARDALGKQVSAELAMGNSMSQGQQRNYTEQVRGAQATRGNILGDSAAFDEALKLTEYGDNLQKNRQSAALNFINSRDLTPNFGTVGAVNPVMPNFSPAQTFNPQVPNLAATTTNGPNTNAAPINQVNPLAFLNPNAGNQGAQFAQNTWSQQFNREANQVDPWMAGLGLAFQGLGAAGGVAGLMAL